MKTTSPSWLSASRWPRLELGKRADEREGASHRKSDGPRMTPAAISPITRGCPTLWRTAPQKRVVMRITTICKISKDVAGGGRVDAGATAGAGEGAGCDTCGPEFRMATRINKG